jgi:putative membrane protein
MMHDWHMWGGGGMWFGPLWMTLWVAVVVAIIIGLLCWLGVTGSATDKSARSASEILDEHYSPGEVDRDEYLKRRQDISGH